MKLVIRFLQKEDMFFVQRKTWRGWRDITYVQCAAVGCATFTYYNKNKEDLLSEILDKKYNMCKKHVVIHEHPTILIY